MNKTALSALFIALLLPLGSYFIVKSLSKTAIDIPPRYFVDSVIEKVNKGKIETDTVWHSLPKIALTNQLGETIGWENMKSPLGNKIIVANFFFTHCPTICPTLTGNMKWLQDALKKSQKVGDRTADYVQFLSFSIDPERDSVAELKKWADRFQVNPVNWWLLTGEKKSIYDLCINEMKLGVVDGEGIDTSFIHTDRFVLIDGELIIRGYYHGLDSTSLAKLSQDIVILSLEKNKKRPSYFSDKLELIGVVFLLTLVALGIFLIGLRKIKNK